MSELKRRLRPSLVIDTEEDQQPTESHQSEFLTVRSNLLLGVQPKLHLEWEAQADLWKQGFKLMVFRNSTGFCPDENPEDVARHGTLIIEKRHNGFADERLAEGTYFYTFVLFKTDLFRITQTTHVVRFSVVVPSAKVALERIRDRAQLRELMQTEFVAPIGFHTDLNKAKIERLKSRRDLRRLRHENEASPKQERRQLSPVVEDLLKNLLAQFDAQLAVPEVMEQLKADPRLAKLTPDDREKFLSEAEARIKKRLHPGDISARAAR